MARHRKAEKDAFIADVLRHDGDDCVLWPFSTLTNSDYGAYIGTLAHRFILQISTGEMGIGLHAAHSCGNARCCNPGHLRWATAKENMDDRAGHGRNPIGGKNGNSKLTESEVASIKTALANNKSCAELAERYGVTEGTIAAIRRGGRWNHVSISEGGSSC